jgi:predicted RNase H-like nuclease (RuvC/YqgF family)
MEGDDLYGDLDGVQMEKSASTANKPKSTTTVALAKYAEEIHARVTALEHENAALKRNMGTLFRTARTEIERKDAEIRSLTKELNQQRPQHDE